jgi:glycosyltransferase involved in cell wall biosynthesis
VIKEATALAAAGFGVEVLGAWIDPMLKARDLELLAGLPFRFTPVLDATQDKLAWLKCRLRVRMAHEWHRRTGRETAWQLGYTTGALLRAARQRKADLFIAHSEPALWALTKLRKQKAESRKQQSEIGDLESRKQKTNAETLKTETLKSNSSKFQLSAFGFQNFRIGVDMEDWFSEDLPPEARRQRPVKLLKSLEQGALSNAAHSTCTSRAMSEALAKAYDCRPPAVIYNAFPWADRQKLDGQFKDRKNQNVPSLHWYSQTLGHGRGLEELFAALPHVQHPLEIHLRGHPVGGFNEWLKDQLPEKWRARVFIHDLVSNDELLSRIAEHDIGFAGEQKYCRSRDLTVTNKILHYLLGGLGVVASDTTGQCEVAAQAGVAVQIYPSGNSQALATELNALLNSREALQAAKAAALQAAEKNFCWERQVPVLLSSINHSLP